MHLIDRIGLILGSVKVIDRYGPIVGIVAFVGLAVLAFLLFQQAREIRRLREWAGRAPERAAEAADAQGAAAEARQEAISGPRPSRWERLRAGAAAGWNRVAGTFARGWHAVDRGSPVDARILAVLLAVAVLAAAVVTSGFGLVGSSSKAGNQAGTHPGGIRVAVLNGTEESGVSAVAGLASKVAHHVVKPAGYKVGPVANAPGSFATTVVMFKPGHGADAKALATAVQPKLGTTPVQSMNRSTRSVAHKADLALVIGLDDSRFGQASG